MARRRPRDHLSGRQIRLLRETLGESVTAFARKLGVHRGTVHRWERGDPPRRGIAREFLLLLWRQAGFGEP